MFGPIEVHDAQGERRLLLNGQQQGAALLDPPASVVDRELPDDAPGPLSSSAYANGWLLAGGMNPHGTGLMIGLGSGAGAVQLLFCCPDVELCIVEIDPILTQMALSNYPLLDYYQNIGRLNIIVEDANDYLVANRDDWDFGLADAYDGGQAVIDSYMPALCGRCKNIYVNVIDTLAGKSMLGVAQMMDQAGKPVAEVIKAVPFHIVTSFEGRSNWILTSQEPDLEALSEFQPFSQVDAPAHEVSWDHFITSTLGANV